MALLDGRQRLQIRTRAYGGLHSRHDSSSSTNMGGPSVTGGRRAADRAEPRHRGAAAPIGPAAAASARSRP